MAYPTLPNSFVTNTTILGSDINDNFAALSGAISDGGYDVNFNVMTAAGAGVTRNLNTGTLLLGTNTCSVWTYGTMTTKFIPQESSLTTLGTADLDVTYSVFGKTVFLNIPAVLFGSGSYTSYYGYSTNSLPTSIRPSVDIGRISGRAMTNFGQYWRNGLYQISTSGIIYCWPWNQDIQIPVACSLGTGMPEGVCLTYEI
jgi:hypothetical protein